MRTLLLVLITLGLSGCADTDHATMTVDFGGESKNQHVAVEFDPDARPSADLYGGKDVQHPAYYTVHDLMVDWGGSVGFGYFDGLGFFVQEIDGVGGGECNFWQLSIDGEASEEGITTARVIDGMEIDWTYAAWC